MKIRIPLIVIIIALTTFVNTQPGMAMPQPAAVVTYYVSSSMGSDSYNGFSESTPFATVSKVNSLTLQPGDRVLFKCGDTWRATPLVISRSGSAGSPITFGSYPAGCANKPVLSGAQPISGWAAFATNIYVADLSAGANVGKFANGVNQVFRNGTRLTLGRWPNIDDSNFDQGYSFLEAASATQLTDSQLPNANWQNAILHIKSIRWAILNRRVASSSGTALNLAAGADCWGGCAGWGYFLNNSLAALDQDGEWYYDSSNHRLYLYSASGTPIDVEGSVVLNTDDRSWGGVLLSADLGTPITYVVVENFGIQNWFRHGITTPTNMNPTEIHDLTLRNNSIRDVDGIGINLETWVWSATDGRPDGWRGGYNLTVTGNTIERANNMGINTFGRNSTFSNNVVRDIARIENLGATGMGCGLTEGGADGGICTEDGDGIRIKIDKVNDSGNSLTFSGNRLERIGHNGFDVFGFGNTFTHNVIIQACISKGDCGGVRTYGNYNINDTPVHDLTFTENIIVDTQGNTDGCRNDFKSLFGFGLYLDTYSRNIAVTGNTIINSTAHGILFQNSTGSLIGNTLYNNGSTDGAQVYLGAAPASVSTQTGNILYSLNPGAWTLALGDPSRLGTSNNNTFFNPYKANHISANGDKSLALWKSFSGKDGASIEHWFTLTPGTPPNSQIFYNDTAQIKIFDLGNTVYKDLSQNIVFGSLTLQPYQSKVLVIISNTGITPDKVAVYRRATGSAFWLNYNFATASFIDYLSLGDGGSSANCYSAPMDFDGDGVAERTHLCGGGWHFFETNGVFVKSIFAYMQPGDMPVPGDYDGDGTDEVAVYRRVTGGAYWLFYDFATASFTNYLSLGDGGTTATCYPAAMDFDGDGVDELTHLCGGGWHFFETNGSFVKSIFAYMQNGDLPVPGDYNGDGTDEVAVYRRVTGGAYWLNYDFATASFTDYLSLGDGGTTAACYPAAMDFDADGIDERTHLCGGGWHFFETNGAFVKSIFAYMQVGDKPVPGKYGN